MSFFTIIPNKYIKTIFLFQALIIPLPFVSGCQVCDGYNCKTDSECGENRYCLNGLCVECREDRHCQVHIPESVCNQDFYTCDPPDNKNPKKKPQACCEYIPAEQCGNTPGCYGDLIPLCEGCGGDMVCRSYGGLQCSLKVGEIYFTDEIQPIKQFLYKARSSLNRCFLQHISQEATLGMIQVEITLSGSSVSSTIISTAFNNPKLEGCVKNVLKEVAYPEPKTRDKSNRFIIFVGLENHNF